MTTLKLKKKSKGSYISKARNVHIAIDNPFVCVGMGSNAWQLTIYIRDNQKVNEYFPTKKKAVLFATNWTNENILK